MGVLEETATPARSCEPDEEQQIVAHCLDIERSLGLLLVRDFSDWVRVLALISLELGFEFAMAL